MSATTKLEVPKPKGFAGKPKDVAPFLQQLDMYFNATNNDAINNQQKIAYAVTLIDNDSDTFYWKEQHFHEEERAVARGSHCFPTWEAFKEAFKKAFPVYAKGDKALMLLIKTKQGRTPMSGSCRNKSNSGVRHLTSGLLEARLSHISVIVLFYCFHLALAYVTEQLLTHPFCDPAPPFRFQTYCLRRFRLRYCFLPQLAYLVFKPTLDSMYFSSDISYIVLHSLVRLNLISTNLYSSALV